ncbi:MAG: type II secretion system protein [Puniceicoccales bacterium]
MHPNPTPKSSHRGFTLVELLCIIAVLAVLATLILPALSKVRTNAENSKCLSNLRNLGTAVHLHWNDDSRRTNPSMTTWHNDLLPYLGYPEGVTTYSELTDLSPGVATNMTLWCPSVDFEDADPIVQRDRNCYGINMSYFASAHNTNPDKRLTAFDVADHGSEIIAFLDANNRNVFHSTPSRIGTGRHGDHVNVVFVDGHAESVPYNGTSETLDPDWRVLFDGPDR